MRALPHLRHDRLASFLDRPYDPGNAHSTPYFWGTTGIAYDRTRVAGPIDSWSALWDERLRGRILMLDDPREAFMAALKLRGHSLNTTDPRVLQEARDLLIRQRPLVRTYNSTNYEDVLLSRDVWVAQGWSGQFVKAMEQDPDIVYVVPKEGSTLFIDNLAIPLSGTTSRSRARVSRLRHGTGDCRRDLPDDALLHHQPGSLAASAARHPQQSGHVPTANGL